MFPDILQKAGFKKEVLLFFENSFFSDSLGRALFPYKSNGNAEDIEILCPEAHRVPKTAEIWEAGGEITALVRRVYVFSSAINAIAFFYFYPGKLRQPEHVAVASLGLVPCKLQVQYLDGKYPNAEVCAVFDNDILGRVADCKLALWLKGKDAAFMYEAEILKISYQGRLYQISQADFSLFNFQKQTGLRLGVRTYKPGKYHNSFYILFIHSI
ncbi:hypothetical protein WG906_04665 [Pedobacter sp. P351]|uniref:hypothetical protein n=1 Tax=Pedobacter superstes TaxID=3133441 RepID=UPI00309730A6